LFRNYSAVAHNLQNFVLFSRLSGSSVKHHNFFKIEVFAVKVYKNYLWIVMHFA